jgi:hypothetical protein
VFEFGGSSSVGPRQDIASMMSCIRRDSDVIDTRNRMEPELWRAICVGRARGSGKSKYSWSDKPICGSLLLSVQDATGNVSCPDQSWRPDSVVIESHRTGRDRYMHHCERGNPNKRLAQHTCALQLLVRHCRFARRCSGVCP